MSNKIQLAKEEAARHCERCENKKCGNCPVGILKNVLSEVKDGE